MASTRSQPVGIKQLSSELNLAVGTISRALNDQPGVHEKTRRRVLDAADKLGYVPDLHAKGFRTRRTHQIGVIVPSVRDVAFLEKIRSAHETAWERGYQLSFAASEWDVDYEAKICRDMLGRGIDGLITLTPASPTRWQHFLTLTERDKPVVVVKSAGQDPPESIRQMQRRFSTIEVGVTAAHAEAVQHLIALGHGRIGLLGFDPNSKSSHRNRLAGVLPHRDEPPFSRAAMETIPTAADTIEAGFEAMTDYLRRTAPADRPTALQCLNDNLAMGGLRALADFGLRVPDDVSLIGFHDTEPARYLVPRLSTVSQMHLDLGRRAAELMTDLIEGRAQPPVHQTLETKLIHRESTAPPPPARNSDQRDPTSQPRLEDVPMQEDRRTERGVGPGAGDAPSNPRLGGPRP